MSINSWNIRWMEMAKNFSEWSKDKSTKVGAVIVDDNNRIVSQGYNGFCEGVDDEIESRHERDGDRKYLWTEHAERNAIFTAARAGRSVNGCRIYATWFPCCDCARAIIQTGIKEVITYEPNLEHHKYGESFRTSLEMFNEVGTIVTYLKR